MITIRTPLETIKEVMSIKCMKHIWNALATKKRINNFINNLNTERLGAVCHKFCLYLEFVVARKNVTLKYGRK